MALSRHHTAASTPLSVQDIVAQAQDFDFSTHRSLKNWLRSAQMLLTEAALCEQDGNLQLAYLFLYRHAELVLGKLPAHPEYRDPAFKAQLRLAQRTVQGNLGKLETWKPRIDERHRRYLRAVERREAERKRVHEERVQDQRQRSAARPRSTGPEEGVFEDAARVLDASEHRQLAVDLARREIRRRDATRRSTRQAGVSPNTVAERRRGFVAESPAFDDADGGDDDAFDGVREAGSQLQRHERQPTVEQHGPSSTSYRYPSVPAKEDTMEWKMAPMQPARQPNLSGPPPALPAKPNLADRQPPPLPARITASATAPTPSPPPPPPPPADLPTSRYTFTPHAHAESGAPLRTLFLPPELRTTFLNLAHPNTLANLETCAILCGTLVSNALFISHLVVPDQVATAETCDTTETGDSVLFDFCDARQLLVCGWIHTHPSQSCFLSSRDLHSSAGYQVMLPEAIAIVCAPRHAPDFGVFRLTDPPGLPHVLRCEEKGTFHPHAERHLYTDAGRPGHVLEAPGLGFEVVDLRGK